MEIATMHSHAAIAVLLGDGGYLVNGEAPLSVVSESRLFTQDVLTVYAPESAQPTTVRYALFGGSSTVLHIDFDQERKPWRSREPSAALCCS